MTLHNGQHAPTSGAGLRRFLRPMEIHKSTGLPKTVIYDALACGDLPAFDASRPPRPGKTRKPVYYIDPADFEAWLDRQKTGAK